MYLVPCACAAVFSLAPTVGAIGSETEVCGLLRGAHLGLAGLVAHAIESIYSIVLHILRCAPGAPFMGGGMPAQRKAFDSSFERF